MGCGASGDAGPPPKAFAFRVRIIGGLNLYNSGFGVQLPGTKTTDYQFQGKADPYVRVECEGLTKTTKTILHTQNPVWNEDFFFGVGTQTPTLKLHVFDADFGRDEWLGGAEINLHGLVTDQEREMWIPLTASAEKGGTKVPGELGISVIKCYRMKFCAKQGINVEPMDSFSGSSDCYMKVNVGQQEKQQTATMKWTLNPVWNQYFTFYVPYGIQSVIEMVLFDHDSVGVDNHMGWVYHKLDGKPKDGAVQEFKEKIQHSKGELEYSIADDTFVEAKDPGPVPEAKKKLWPPRVPQTQSFQCRVLGAYNLAAADGCYIDDILDPIKNELWHEWSENKGNSDPFARVECEGQIYDTHHINNTLEPQWSTRMRFIARNRENSELKVQVWDHDIVSNDCIGAVSVPIKMMKPGERTEMWSFLDKGRGEVGIELDMDFQIKCRIVSLHNLPAKDLNGLCDPFVKVTLAGQTHESRVVRDNRNPWIEEDFRWSVQTLVNQEMTFEVLDSDLTLFTKKDASADSMGGCTLKLDKLKHGLPNEYTLELTGSGIDVKQDEDPAKRPHMKIVVTDELPLPESALDILLEKGKEAFENAVKNVTETVDLIKTLKMPDFDKKEEAELEPYDKKIDSRPRYSRINVEVVALRGIKNCTAPIYCGVALPIQGTRFKSKESYNANSADVGENFEFRVPSKITGALEVTLFETQKAAYTAAWSNVYHSKAVLKFGGMNDGDGLIRGSPATDHWIDLKDASGNTLGQAVVRVKEMFRFNVRVLGASGVSTETDPYIVIKGTSDRFQTHTVPKDPAKSRVEGVAGEPFWNEQFTFFEKDKGLISFMLMDDKVLGDEHLGTATFDLNKLRRGVPDEFELTLMKGDGSKGKLKIWIKEEEKMGLLDQIFDAAASAAKLAAAAVGEAVELVADAAKDVANAIGGFFGK